MKNKNKKSNSKQKQKKSQKPEKNNIDIQEDHEDEKDNEEIINTNKSPKNKKSQKTNFTNQKRKNKEKQKNTKNKKKSDKKEEISENEEEEIADAIVLNPSNILSVNQIPKLTRISGDFVENNDINDEYKVAKYFSKTKLLEPKNTNQDLFFLPEEDSILSICNGKIYCLNINNLQLIQTYFYPNNTIINYTYNPKNRQIISLTENSMIIIFDFDTTKIITQIKIHKTVGRIVKIDPSNNFFAVVNSNNNINIYNAKNFTLESSLEGHNHIIYDIIFNPNMEKFEIFSCSEDCTIKIWNILLRKCTNEFYYPGTSVRRLQITNDGNFLIGGTLDNKIYVLKLLGINNNKDKVKPKIYDFNKKDEIINFECMLYYTKILNENDKIKPVILLGDDEGNLFEIDLNNGNIINNFFIGVHQAIVQIYYNENEKYLFILTSEQTLVKLKINITNENISNSIIDNIYPLYCQEILSVKWLDENNLIFSSNDNLLKTYNIVENKFNIYEGHTDFIMNVIIKNNLIITSSKDNTIRIWSIPEIKCIGILKGHSESVNCADIYIKKNINYLISGCKDGSIKLWDIKKIINENNNKNENENIIEINESLSSKPAHDDEVNVFKFSPNGKIAASGSYDKTIKIFDMSNNSLNILKTLTGHKKGITDLNFSPYAKILASCGTDKLIKMWNLTDYTCLNTYEGHLASVLKIDWVYRGTHLISGGGDGLIKLWNIKSSENILTLDAHDGKIWTLDILQNSEILNFITGGTDGEIILWKDNTKETENIKNEENLIKIQKSAQLQMMNYSKEYLQSMKLCLELNHKKNFIENFDKFLQQKINEELEKINTNNKLLLSNYKLPKMKDVDSSNDDLLNVIIRNEKELDEIYTFYNSSEENENIISNAYEKIINNICKDEKLKSIVLENINKIIDIIVENNINVKNCLPAQVLLKIVLQHVSPTEFFKKISKNLEKDKNVLENIENIEDLLAGGVYSSLGIKGAQSLTKEEKKELLLLQKKSKREEETLLQKLEIIEGYSNQHLKRIKKEIIHSQILGYEINKLKTIS